MKRQELRCCQAEFLVACTTLPVFLMRKLNYVVVYSFFVCHFNCTDKSVTKLRGEDNYKAGIS